MDFGPGGGGGGGGVVTTDSLHGTTPDPIWQSQGYGVLLDVSMGDTSEAALRAGVVGAKCVIAIVTDDGPPGTAFFELDYCMQVLQWAFQHKVFVLPVVGSINKGRIDALMSKAPENIRALLLSTDFKDLNRDDDAFWDLGVKEVLAAVCAKTGLKVSQPTRPERP